MPRTPRGTWRRRPSPGLGHVDILVNNAGGSRSSRTCMSARSLAGSHHAELSTARASSADALIDQMIARGWGRIINITGKSEPEHINGAFCAKAGMHSWAKGLSRMVGKHGITVNCIPPGRIHSEQIFRNYTPEYRAVAVRERDPDGPLRRA
jgi:3-oxoacyl-[acyl-carrier protein] reductase